MRKGVSSLTKKYKVCFYDESDKGRTKTTLSSKEFLAENDDAARIAKDAIEASGKTIVAFQRASKKQPR